MKPMRYTPLVFIAVLALMVVPASAVVLNTSVIFADSSIFLTSDDKTNVNSYDYTAPDGYGIVFQTFQARTEGSTYNIGYTFSDNTGLTGSITLTPTGFLGGNYIVVLNGGNSSTTSYSKIPVLNTIYAIPRYAAIVSDPATKNQYLVIADDIGGTTSGAIYRLDTATTAYVQLSKPIASNPITRAYMTSSGNMDILTKSESVQDLIDAQVKAETTTHTGSWFDSLESLLAPLLAMVTGLVSLGNTVSTFVQWFWTGGLFILSAQVFLVIIAAYEAVVLVLSVDDVTEWHIAMKRWIRYQKALWYFFWDIYKFLKDLVKWW